MTPRSERESTGQPSSSPSLQSIGRARRLAVLASAPSHSLSRWSSPFSSGTRCTWSWAGAVVLSVAGGWWAVTRGSHGRLLGMVGLVAGAALLAIGLLGAGEEDWASVAGLLLCLLLLAVAIASARAALRTHLRANSSPGHRVPAPSRPVLVCNPWSGGGKVNQFGLVELAASLYIETGCSIAASTSSNWPGTPLRAAPIAWAWRVVTVRRHSCHPSPSRRDCHSCASRPEPGTTLRWTSASSVRNPAKQGPSNEETAVAI
jgi:hypothetical protein